MIELGGHLAHEWALWMRAGAMSARTIAERVQLVARVEATVGRDSLAIDWRDLATYLDRGNFAPGTKQTYHAHLHAWFSWLLLMEYRPDDPTQKLRAPKGTRRKPRPVTPEQLDTIIATPMHRRTRVMVLLAAYEGLRVHEVAKVRGADVRGGELRVHGKGDREDYLPLHPLVEAAAAAMPRTGLWFPSHVNHGRPITAKAVSDMLGDLMRRAQVPGTAHSLRHFFGTQTLKASGGNLALTRELMRHENIATTAQYTEVDDRERRAAVLALPVGPAARQPLGKAATAS